MHARLTTAQGHPGEIEAVRRLWEDEILPAARQQPGFQGAYEGIVSHNGAKTATRQIETVVQGGKITSFTNK